MEKKKLIGLLKEIRNISGEVSLTGMFKNSKDSLIRNYNTFLKIATDQGLIDTPELFPSLPEDAHIDDVGVSAALLGRYLKDEDEENYRHHRHERDSDLD